MFYTFFAYVLLRFLSLSGAPEATPMARSCVRSAGASSGYGRWLRRRSSVSWTRGECFPPWFLLKIEGKRLKTIENDLFSSGYAVCFRSVPRTTTSCGSAVGAISPLVTTTKLRISTCRSAAGSISCWFAQVKPLKLGRNRSPKGLQKKLWGAVSLSNSSSFGHVFHGGLSEAWPSTTFNGSISFRASQDSSASRVFNASRRLSKAFKGFQRLSKAFKAFQALSSSS